MQVNNQPLVSVILSSYNHPEYLKIALDSLIAQTYKNIEIIVVDDCSENPLNKETILLYTDKYPSVIRYVFQPFNVGIAKNKNSGYRLAKGDFITLLDGDDFYYPEKIEYEISMFIRHPELDVVYSNFIFADAEGRLQSSWAVQDMPEGNIFKQIANEQFPHAMLYNYELIRREIFDKNNYLDETLNLYEDWDFRIRYGATAQVGYTGKILSVYRRSNSSVSVKSSLTSKIDAKIKVIEKNKKLIESHPQLKTFRKSFLKKSELQRLFDTSVDYKHYMLSCIKMFVHYPFNLIDILKSVKYYHLMRKKPYLNNRFNKVQFIA